MTFKELKDRLHSEGIIPTLEELQAVQDELNGENPVMVLHMLELWVLHDPYHPAYDEVAKRVEARFKNEMDV